MSVPRSMDKSSSLEYINQMFPTEASLSGVEPLMQKIHCEIRRVDASILGAVRQQLLKLKKWCKVELYAAPVMDIGWSKLAERCLRREKLSCWVIFCRRLCCSVSSFYLRRL
ncbi:hypothetical protein SOVF_040380 isoform A [Spinacia oleracea]|uniref:Uncharacterized protein isoform X2 n=1 Tax=Spinacia oleracea TaxID=3562 RepID=A0A9R0JFS1_SPIOL|nr:uncharacterized protein LOC110804834 isoform X2 [Spinacia oleracea]KNA21764.1 hypothetical protein SOVF_040380 isoform A [Spinacia oleracea]